jgi:methionyl-tRNA synthetase
MVLYHKYFEGNVQGENEKIDITDTSMHDAIGKTYDAIVANVEAYKFRQALFEVIDLARFGNKYLTEHEPWKTHAQDPEKTAHVLTNCLLLIGHLGACLQPFLPDTSKKIFRMLNLSKTDFQWSDEIVLSKGHTLNAAEHLFTKIEDAAIDAQREKLEKAKKENQQANAVLEHAAQKASVTYDDFMKMDIRSGTILEAEKVAKTKKLLKLKIDTGLDQRTVVSGIAEYFAPEDIIGQRVSLLLNLEPRIIAGIESQGMILMAEGAGGVLRFVHASGEDAVNGSVIK